jgi:hypothetical protein
MKGQTDVISTVPIRPSAQVLRSACNRRDFLTRCTFGATATALGFAPGLAPATDNATPPKVAFFVVGDTHYLAHKETPSRMDSRSAEICRRLVDALNGLLGTAIPAEAGGGKVAQASGLIDAGDTRIFETSFVGMALRPRRQPACTS